MIASLSLLALLAVQAPDPLANNPEIPNYYRIQETIAAAGQPTEAGFEAFKAAGFKTILNLRTADEGATEEKAKVEAMGFTYVNIPIGSPDFTSEQQATFRSLVEDADNKPLLIHCASSNRVGAMWYIHQVLDKGRAEQEALEEAKKAGLKSLEQAARDYVDKQKK